MIILFDDNETLFTGLGLGVLKDAKTCVVTESINDEFELEMTYPTDGQFYSKIKLNKIIFCKPNPYSEAQPYRINLISKPINGVVTINASHISYDTNGIIIKPISGSTLKSTLDEIQNGSILEHNFKLYTDKTDTKTFKTTNYYNLRALLMGGNESVIDTYKGELYFNKFNIYLLERRGSDKGAQVRYSKNLKDITHEISYERLYNGVYPFFHQETTSETSETVSGEFKKCYIVGSKPYQDGWLSYTKDGDAYHPIDETPVQIDTEGEYFDKVYSWNTINQRYVEKIYNQSITIIDSLGNILGSSDTPSWIYIDWSGLPRFVVKANVDGYFKLITETDWTFKKKGEVIIDSSIKEAATNLMLYYSEVVPSNSTSTTEETTSITHIQLKDNSGIIYLETDAAKEMKYNRILALDLTSEFEETPTEDQLETKAKEYIEENKIGQYKYNTTLSFVDLSSTTEGVEYTNLEKIELGDTVKVVHEEAEIDVNLRVISTKYNVILDRYEDIELGELPDKLSGSSVQNGDGISSLTNDKGYTDVSTVNKLIAKTVTADYIQAKNAKLTQAQIEELSASRIKVSGMIEATQFELDTLVAKLLTADNAVIKQTLEAGKIKVKGDIDITSGQINITSIAEDSSTVVFNVDREGNVTANSVKITGGELNINDNFSVTPEGILTAKGAEIQGIIKIIGGSIEIGNAFKVTEDGAVTASNMTITGGSLNINNAFTVTNQGAVTASNMTITGGSLNINNVFTVTNQGAVTASNMTITGGSLNINNAFTVTNQGAVTASNMTITGGSLNINDVFTVDSSGLMTATNANIIGNINATELRIKIESNDSYLRLKSSIFGTGNSFYFEWDDSQLIYTQIKIKERDGHTVPSDVVISGTYKPFTRSGSALPTRAFSCIIPAGESSGIVEVSIPPEGYYGNVSIPSPSRTLSTGDLQNTSGYFRDIHNNFCKGYYFSKTTFGDDETFSYTFSEFTSISCVVCTPFKNITTGSLAKIAIYNISGNTVTFLSDEAGCSANGLYIIVYGS